MKTTIFLVMMAANFSSAALDVNRIADAIYRAEGGAKASSPYGIKAVKVRNAAHAREVCIRTIKNAHAEWDGKGNFIDALGRRYCPPATDPVGHKNWVKNVKWFLK